MLLSPSVSRIELKMADNGNGQSEPIGEVVGCDRFGVEFVAHGEGKPSRVSCPIIKAE